MTAALAERALSTALEDSLITTLDAEVIRACLPPGADIAVLRPHLRAVLKQRRRERLGLRVLEGGSGSHAVSIHAATKTDNKKSQGALCEALTRSERLELHGDACIALRHLSDWDFLRYIGLLGVRRP